MLSMYSLVHALFCRLQIVTQIQCPAGRPRPSRRTQKLVLGQVSTELNHPPCFPGTADAHAATAVPVLVALSWQNVREGVRIVWSVFQIKILTKYVEIGEMIIWWTIFCHTKTLHMQIFTTRVSTYIVNNANISHKQVWLLETYRECQFWCSTSLKSPCRKQWHLSTDHWYEISKFNSQRLELLHFYRVWTRKDDVRGRTERQRI